MSYNGVVSIVTENKPEILRRIAEGEPLKTIAHSMGLGSHAAIINRIGQDPDYQEALAASAWAKLQRREGELEVADTNVTVTRADRLLGHARWFAERVAKRWFAAETRLTGADGGPLQVQIVRFGQTLEGETVSSTPNAALLPAVQPPSKTE